jgi:sulfur carrier protein ThiS
MEQTDTNAFLEYRGKMIPAAGGQTLRDALHKANLVPEAVLAVRQGEMLTDDMIIRAGDRIRLVAVISGG